MPDTAFSHQQSAASTVIEAAFNYIEPIPSGENPYRRMDALAPVSYTHLTLPTICSV